MMRECASLCACAQCGSPSLMRRKQRTAKFRASEQTSDQLIRKSRPRPGVKMRKAGAKRRFALGQEGAVARSGVAHWALAGAPKRN